MATVREATEAALRMRQVDVPRAMLTLDDAAGLLREDLQSSDASSQTRRYYETQLVAVMAHGWPGSTILASIGPDDIRAFIAMRLRHGVSAATVIKHVGVLRRLFRLAMRDGYLRTNPVAAVRLPRARPQRYPHMTPAELAAVVAGVADRADADLIWFAFHTGLRREELSRLVAADVDLTAGTIRVHGKTDNRTVRIATVLRDVVARVLLRAAGGSLFGTANRIGYRFGRWRRCLGEKRLHPHAMRHSFGTALVEAGVPLQEVQRAMGHKTVAMTLRYWHGSDTAAQQAVDAISFPHAPPSTESPPATST